MRWGVFKDYRGVAYCEPINEGIEVWIKEIPGTPDKRNLLGRKTPGRPAQQKFVTVFLESHYSRKDYYASAFEPAPPGFRHTIGWAYMKENHWGRVQLLWIINDDAQGSRLQYLLRLRSPDSSMDIKDRDIQGVPDPEVERLLKMLG